MGTHPRRTIVVATDDVSRPLRAMECLRCSAPSYIRSPRHRLAVATTAHRLPGGQGAADLRRQCARRQIRNRRGRRVAAILRTAVNAAPLYSASLVAGGHRPLWFRSRRRSVIDPTGTAGTRRHAVTPPAGDFTRRPHSRRRGRAIAVEADGRASRLARSDIVIPLCLLIVRRVLRAQAASVIVVAPSSRDTAVGPPSRPPGRCREDHPRTAHDRKSVA